MICLGENSPILLTDRFLIDPFNPFFWLQMAKPSGGATKMRQIFLGERHDFAFGNFLKYLRFVLSTSLVTFGRGGRGSSQMYGIPVGWGTGGGAG